MLLSVSGFLKLAQGRAVFFPWVHIKLHLHLYCVTL